MLEVFRLVMTGAWLFITTSVGLVMLFARTGPDDAASNISKWIEKAGLKHVPGWLKRRGADKWISRIGTAFLVLAAAYGGLSVAEWTSGRSWYGLSLEQKTLFVLGILFFGLSFFNMYFITYIGIRSRLMMLEGKAEIAMLNLKIAIDKFLLLNSISVGIFWKKGGAEPEMFGLDEVCSKISGAESVLEFENWIRQKDYPKFSRCLVELMVSGSPFSLVVASRTRRLVEINGKSIDGWVGLQLTPRKNGVDRPSGEIAARKRFLPIDEH